MQVWQIAVGGVEFMATFLPIWFAIGRWEHRRFEAKMLSEATLEAQLAHSAKNLFQARKAQADNMAKVRELQRKIDAFNNPKAKREVPDPRKVADYLRPGKVGGDILAQYTRETAWIRRVDAVAYRAQWPPRKGAKYWLHNDYDLYGDD